ncbi:S-adenosylmethionine:tRNA ribosyltransferase-isomerase [Candidatus Annandia adelgestsuga]|uniref:S-adenosylmethionine:tRNA ribosyltransferase-isomerase n=2 Tax=Candidatus Annandia adelgestsuga TaxID=1302411 RepID=A0A3S9J7S2_9ENTR|nr:S-adenosylmethionine:tRNA ribosyltransferase-isomerase [Candidatus Annandia adelgestsuga]
MHLKNFYFKLSKNMISQHPIINKNKKKLMILDSIKKKVYHGKFNNIINILNKGDLLILNNTRVIPARIFAKKISGGKIEILIEKILNNNMVLGKIKSNKKIKINTFLIINYENNIYATIKSKYNIFYKIKFISSITVWNIIKIYGKIPLPPYIKKKIDKKNKNEYQTIYSSKYGSIASPTAGLHFDKILFKNLIKKGIKIIFITLHIGSGTFQSIKSLNIKNHKIHKEQCIVTKNVIKKIIKCKLKGNRIVAVGTSTLRALESTVFKSKYIISLKKETNIFIYPGYKYKIVDALITNFHLPCSTLIILVSSFAGYYNIMSSYRIAIKNKYKFFSYGDSMFIIHNPKAFLDKIN